MIAATVGSRRLSTVMLVLYIESPETAICFLSCGDDVGALAMGAPDALDEERGRLGAMVGVAGEVVVLGGRGRKQNGGKRSPPPTPTP